MIKKCSLFLLICTPIKIECKEFFEKQNKTLIKEKAVKRAVGLVKQKIAPLIKRIKKLPAQKQQRCMGEIAAFKQKLNKFFSKSSLQGQNLVQDPDVNAEYKNMIKKTIQNIKQSAKKTLPII